MFHKEILLCAIDVAENLLHGRFWPKASDPTRISARKRSDATYSNYSKQPGVSVGTRFLNRKCRPEKAGKTELYGAVRVTSE